MNRPCNKAVGKIRNQYKHSKARQQETLPAAPRKLCHKAYPLAAQYLPLQKAPCNQGQKNSRQEIENHLSVAGQLKLRFLGNHDTVSWTFDAARAQAVYGTEKAKALWMAMAFIDGTAFIYQGDEDPAAYRLKGENLEAFFTELIDAKKTWLPHFLDTEYLKTESPVFAFYRISREEGICRLVLINLSAKEQTYALPEGAALLKGFGECSQDGLTLQLAPYAGGIWEVSVPEN